MENYLPFLIMLGVAMLVAVGGLAISAIVGPKRFNRVKVENYECGIDPTPSAGDHGRFPVKYYLVALTFIVFDIEVVFLYPFAVARDQMELFVVLQMVLFIALIFVAFFYVLRRKGLDWD